MPDENTSAEDKAEIMRMIGAFRLATSHLHPMIAVSSAINFAANVIVTHTVMAGASRKSAEEWCAEVTTTMYALIDKNFDAVQAHHEKRKVWKEGGDGQTETKT